MWFRCSCTSSAPSLSFIVIAARNPGRMGARRSGGRAARQECRCSIFGLGSGFFTRTYTFWAGVIGGCFLTTASHGTEQLLVQRLLAARDERASRAALLASWVVIFIQFTLFLMIGMCLFVLYRENHWTAARGCRQALSAVHLGASAAGIAGLVIAAILAAAMSNLSAALNSLASTTVMDFWKPLSRASAQRQRVAARDRGACDRALGCDSVRRGDVRAALGQRAASRIVDRIGHLRLAAGRIPARLADRRVGEMAAMSAMCAGLALMLYVRFGRRIAWTWYVLIGTAAHVRHGLLLSFLIQGDSVWQKQPSRTEAQP